MDQENKDQFGWEPYVVGHPIRHSISEMPFWLVVWLDCWLAQADPLQRLLTKVAHNSLDRSGGERVSQH